MLHFYDGAIRRYVIQTIRALSNFSVKYNDGTLVRVPVVYGDPDRQGATIMNQNSENTLIGAPRIAVYITGISLDRTRLADSTFVGKLQLRERQIVTNPTTLVNEYTTQQGRNYTVERLMPTPFILSMNANIWAANTDQKLQLLEQILVLFNPSLELQTSDNYIDWTSLTVLNLGDISWSSRQVPVGTDSSIDIATLGLTTPIWISPPVKVKHMGVITKIIANVFSNSDTSWSGVDGLGLDPNRNGTTLLSSLITTEIITITDYVLSVYNGKAVIYENSESINFNQQPAVVNQQPVNWKVLFDKYPSRYLEGVNRIFLQQANNNEVVGTIELDAEDPTVLNISWFTDTYPSDDDIVTTQDREASGRSPGTFDAIIDPQKVYPGSGISDLQPGDRFLIIEPIGSPDNQSGPVGWKNLDSSDFYANENDIIEWQGSSWHVIFESSINSNTLIYQTNIFNGARVQYCWNGVAWVKSFEGEYVPGTWRIEL